MPRSRVTVKGQITIPKEVRSALAIREGDSVLFLVEGDHAILRRVRRRTLQELHGALPATRPYPGHEEIRREVRRKRGRRVAEESGS